MSDVDLNEAFRKDGRIPLVREVVSSHARDQLWARYGLVLADWEWLDVWLAIVNTALKEPVPEAVAPVTLSSRHTARNGDRLEQWLVTIKGITVRLCYKPDIPIITTALFVQTVNKPVRLNPNDWKNSGVRRELRRPSCQLRRELGETE